MNISPDNPVTSLIYNRAILTQLRQYLTADERTFLLYIWHQVHPHTGGSAGSAYPPQSEASTLPELQFDVPPGMVRASRNIGVYFSTV